MSYISDDLNAEFIDTFKMLDPKDSGSISGTQLGLALKVHGIEPANTKIQEMITQSSKSISFSEYIAIVVTHLTGDSWCRNEIQEVFDVFDKEGVGKLAPQQMKRVAVRLGEKLNDEEIEQQFLQFDTNDELKVEPRGFSALILSNDEISLK
jgi:calmodulin